MIFKLSIFFMSVNSNNLLYLCFQLNPQLYTEMTFSIPMMNDISKELLGIGLLLFSSWPFPAPEKQLGVLLELKNRLMSHEETEFLQLLTLSFPGGLCHWCGVWRLQMARHSRRLFAHVSHLWLSESSLSSFLGFENAFFPMKQRVSRPHDVTEARTSPEHTTSHCHPSQNAVPNFSH